MSLVYVQGLGFRPADGLTLVEPVEFESEGWSVTVNSVAADSERTQVAITIYGPFKMRSERGGPEIDYRGFITARNRSGSVSSEPGRIFPLSHSFSHAGTSISCTANMDALAGRDLDLDILIGEPLPITIIPVKLKPLAEYAVPAHAVDVSDEHHGVVLTARAVGRGDDLTAVLLHATLRPHPRQRFMRGLGSMREDPRSVPGVTITDKTGTNIEPYAMTRELSAGPEMRAVVVYPGLPRTAREVVITVPFITLAEYTGAPVKLAIPSESDITLGDDEAHVKVERTDAPRGGRAVGVEVTGRWHDDRRLLFAESLTVGEKYGGVGFRGMPAEPPIQTYAEDPTGEGATVALESPVVQLRGPWRLPVTLP